MSAWIECDAAGCTVTERTHPYDWRGVQIRPPRDWRPSMASESVGGFGLGRYLPVVGGHKTWERASYAGTLPWFHAHSDECLEEVLRAMPEGAKVVDTSHLPFAVEELHAMIEDRLLAAAPDGDEQAAK